MKGVPMRKCDQVLREIAWTAGVGESVVARRFVESAVSKTASAGFRYGTAIAAVGTTGFVR